MALAARAHRRQQREQQPDRPEVVDVDRALEVVEAVVGELDRAADRLAGVADDDVDVTALGERPRRERLDAGGVGEVGGMCPRVAPRGLYLRCDLLQPVRGAGRQQDRGTAGRKPARGRLAEPVGGPGDQHHLAGDGLPQLLLADPRRWVDQRLGRANRPCPYG